MKIRSCAFILSGLILLGLLGYIVYIKAEKKITYTFGQPIDSLNGVYVYYNGKTNHVAGRNLTSDNYNLGIKYQCVEFVKRYYYQHLNHKMPDSYGDAKDFFDEQTNDGQINQIRNLVQYQNPGHTKPKADDLVVFRATSYNSFGHVAIISKVKDFRIEVIQQNTRKTRKTYLLIKRKGKWLIMNKRIMGWLRKE